MKTVIKSIIAMLVLVIITSLSACKRQSGCGTWSQTQYKKQYHSQTPKDPKNFKAYRRYNS